MAHYTRDEAIAYIEENDVKFIRLAFCDVLGRHKNISIMPSELPKAFADGIRIDYHKITGQERGKVADLYLRPDPSTLSVLPWRPQTGRVVRFYCAISLADGTPYANDARSLLQNTVEECRKEGFSCRIGLYSEFYLFKVDEAGNPTQEPWDKGGYLDIAPLDRGENIRREICLSLESMGIVPEKSYHEAGPGQNEIDFRAADALSSADDFVTYKNVVTSIAGRNGAYASFDPKPMKWDSGNGLHLKFNLHRAGEDLSVSDPETEAQFLAGVFHRMRDITVFLNAKKQSYERFGENEAPRNITWSTKRASRLLQIPTVDGHRAGFLLRSPDATINPYLAFAVILKAGLAGIEHKETLPPETDGSLADEQAAGKLPVSLEEAIAAARQSDFLKGEEMAAITERYLGALETEND